MLLNPHFVMFTQPNTETQMKKIIFPLVLAVLTINSQANGDLLNIENASFEDTTGQSVFNEFTFGTPAGWANYDPNNVIGLPGVFIGTLIPNGVDFFNDTAPDGSRVGILFNSQQQGAGEYGFEQTLVDTLQANTRYTLSVEVGNIASGFATDGTFYNLDEFPGYRVDLLAGGVVVASDDDSLTIAEAEFETSVLEFTVGDSHALLGQQLGIRLVNLNEIPDGFTQGTSPDLEVDFDLVTLDATSIPEPRLGLLCCLAIAGLGFRNRSKFEKN